MGARSWTASTTTQAVTVLALILALLGAYGERWNLDILADLPARSFVGVGDRAPEFRAPDLAGATVSLADFRGRIVVVNFWATWCPPCRVELPELDAYQAEMDGQIVVLGIDTGESSGAVHPFVRQHGLRFPILLDGDGAIATAYGVPGLPTSLIVDRSGVVRERVTGPMTRDTLARRVERLL